MKMKEETSETNI